MDVERTIKFILEQQAHSEVRMAKFSAALEELRRSFAASREEDAIRREAIGAAMVGLVENLEKLTVRVDRMAEASQEADDRFAEFVVDSDRRLSSPWT